MTMRYSIVIVSWNRKQQVLETLRQVLDVSAEDDEVILVDNGSTDGTCAAVCRSFPMVRVVPIERNLGVAAYNRGFALAGGKYVVILDDDSFPQKGSLEVAYEFLEDRSDVGGIAGNIFGGNGRNQTMKFFHNSLPTQPVPVASFVGCGAILRKDVLNALKGYCPGYFLYWNEDELALRLWNSGYPLIFHPEVRFTHLASSKNRTSRRTIFYMLRNGLWFVRTISQGRARLSCVGGLLLAHAVSTIRYPSLAVTYSRAVYEGLSKPVPRVQASSPTRQVFDEYLCSNYGLMAVSQVILKRVWKGLHGFKETGD